MLCEPRTVSKIRSWFPISYHSGPAWASKLRFWLITWCEFFLDWDSEVICIFSWDKITQALISSRVGCGRDEWVCSDGNNCPCILFPLREILLYTLQDCLILHLTKTLTLNKQQCNDAVISSLGLLSVSVRWLMSDFWDPIAPFSPDHTMLLRKPIFPSFPRPISPGLSWTKLGRIFTQLTQLPWNIHTVSISRTVCSWSLDILLNSHSL